MSLCFFAFVRLFLFLSALWPPLQDVASPDVTGAALGVSDWRRTSCLAVSGGTGELLARHVRMITGTTGIRLIPLADLDGDGVPDIAVGAMTHNGPCKGSVEIFSGKDGQSLRRVTKEAPRPR